MPVPFPDILLPDVLDFLDVDTLLLSVMPVSRHWRAQAVEHRMYWRSIRLVTARIPAMPGQLHSLSLELFCLRLSRTGTRPIDVTIIRHDMPAVLDLLALHLAHIRHLSLHADAHRWDTIFLALQRTAAPLLLSFRMSSRFGSIDLASPVAPTGLFAGHAPMLSDVMLTDIAVGSGVGFPASFGAVVSLHIGQVDRDCSLPDLDCHFRQLKHLTLFGDIGLENPSLLLDKAWRGLASLALLGRRTSASWNILTFAMARVPLVFLSDCDADGVYFLTLALGTRLSAQYPAMTDRTGFDVEFRAFDDSHRRVGKVHMRLVDRSLAWPRPPPIMAFQDDRTTDRIVELVLPMGNWAEFVGERHLTRFAFMERLVLMLMRPEDVKRPHAPDATISCPRLQRVIMRRGDHRPPTQLVVEADDVTAFVGRALPDAPFPVELELEAVTLHGSFDGFQHLFSSFIFMLDLPGDQELCVQDLPTYEPALRAVFYDNAANLVRGFTAASPTLKLRSNCDLAYVASLGLALFARDALPRVRYPIALRLCNVLLDGGPQVLVHFFSSIEYFTTTEKVYPYPFW
ncbi:hypothetical protein AURDEDRAFT_161494 [Auricularia subglabra TFB-10046 SS5]|nr:hypothetical protein AURDEDRAFT_161494 [Auricularia subglabra TFB-10046 SS5]